MKSTSELTLSQKQKLKNTPQTSLFAIFSAVVLPIWLIILLPLTIIYLIITKILSLLGLRKQKVPKSPAEIDSSSMEATKVPKDEREFDLVIYGATGFTGNFLCEYLAKNYYLIVC